jgi:hypothetical protein
MKINSNENWLSSPSQASRNGHHILPGVLSPGLRGCGKSFLLALAACLTIVASGCGSRAADPATQTGGTGSSQVSPQLTSSGVNLNFGSVAVNSAATQSLTLTSTGTAPVMITSGTITGVGFTIVAQTFPVTLNPSQSLTLQLQFDPAAAGSVVGQLTISSNSTTGGTTLVVLSGTGTTASSPQASPQLTISSASLSFGSIPENTAIKQSLTLVSTGTSPVTISSGTVTGAGFTIVTQTFPILLNPGQSLTVQVQFDPTTAGALSGQLTISSNSTTGGTGVVALSGTGTAVAHEVALSWNAPVSSPDPVAGYNIYRSTGSGSFVLINSSPDVIVAYTDAAVTTGVAYSYQVTSVDFSGMESVPSNGVTVTIP